MIKKSKKLKKKQIGSSKSSAACSNNGYSKNYFENKILDLTDKNLDLQKQLTECNNKLQMAYLSIAALEEHAFTTVDKLQDQIKRYKELQK